MGSFYFKFQGFKTDRLKIICPFRFNNCFIVLALVLFPVFSVFGQNPVNKQDEYLQTIWTTEEGLPQNSVNDIVQTGDGYLWLATFGGLVRFDGVKFTIFNSGNTPGLKNNRLISLYEDRDGTLWGGGQAGEVIALKDGVGTTYTTADGVPGGNVWDITADADGKIWVGAEFGVARFENGRFRAFTKADGLPGNQVWSIKTSSAGKLLLATSEGIAEFDGQKFTSYQFPFSKDNRLWTSFEKRKAGGFLFGISKTLVSFPEEINNFPQHFPQLPDGNLRMVFEEKSGRMWISTNSPNAVYHFQNNKFIPFPIKPEEEIRSMFEDREGNLWLGSDGGGLIRLKRRKITSLSVENGFPDDRVRAVTDDGSGGVWISTATGLVHHQNGKFKTYTDRDGLVTYYITALCRRRNGDLWIGTNHGLNQLKDGKFTTISTSLNLLNTEIYSLFEDTSGRLWVGTGIGLSVYHNGEFKQFHQSDGLVNDNAHFITQTRDGAIWIGTVSGVSRYENGTFTNYTTKQGLSNDYIRDIFEDSDGSLWLATYGGGLNRLKDGKISAITTQQGFPDDFISRLLPDGKGNFWFLGNRGIFKLNRNELNDLADGHNVSLSIISFGTEDGMKSSEGNGGTQPAGWRMDDGRMWFTTIKGLSIVDAQEENKLSPPVVIETIKIDSRESVIRNPIPTIEINPEQENLEIAYTGLSFSRPEQVRFKYQMIGLNDNWVDAGTRRTAYYSYLPPGNYTFQVIAENGDGVWSDSPATMKFIVYPSFWRTWWFWLLSAFLILGLIIVIFRLRVAQVERARLAQEEFSRRLINAHETERRRIAAELHDGLGQTLAMIKNRAVLGTQTAQDLPTAKEQLEQISAQSAHAISEVREITYNLRPYLLDRLGLTKAINSMLNKFSDTGVIKINADIDEIDGMFSNEAEMSIYRIIQESLNNVLKHSQADEVKVEIRKLAKEIQITVQDNGKGFDVNETKIKDRQKGGFGLIGLTERVRMLSGTHTIQSVKGKGTTISIKINFVKNQKEEKYDG